MVILSPRLQAVLDFCRVVEQGSRPGNQLIHTPLCGVLADIGTDHAYLPIAAIEQKICKSAIACDLHPGPLKIAKENISKAGFASHIQTRLGDGLKPISPGEADCIVITGMGGMRIWGILMDGMEQAQLAKRLVLQPQHDIVLLRKNLHKAGFEIQDERLVREKVGGKELFYIVIAARYTAANITWTEREYFLGKHLIEAGGEIFTAYKKREREKIALYEWQIREPTDINEFRNRLEWLTD